MRRTSRPTLGTSWSASNPAATKPRRCAGPTSPRRTARGHPIAPARWGALQPALGIPTVEDKVAQRAIAMVLEAVYEQDFLPCSYGFRPGRSAHQALQQLSGAIVVRQQYWVLDVDIRKYFDSIPHSHLRAILDQRVTGGVIRRVIGKWLKAGVLEDGLLHFVTAGTPQGGVI